MNVKVTLRHAYQEQRTDEGIAPTHSQSQHEVGGWSAPHPRRFALRKDPAPIAEEVGWASGPFCIDPKKLARPGLDPRTVKLVLIRNTRPRYPGRLMAVTIHPDVKRFQLPR